MHRLNILDRLHARLLEIVGTALPLIASSLADADLIGLAYLRDEMIATIEAYGVFVHQHVLDSAARSGDPDRIRLAQEIHIGCLALEQTYQSFTARWRYRDGISNWPEYRLSAIVMMKQIRNHVRSASRWDEIVPHRTALPA